MPWFGSSFKLSTNAKNSFLSEGCFFYKSFDIFFKTINGDYIIAHRKDLRLGSLSFYLLEFDLAHQPLHQFPILLEFFSDFIAFVFTDEKLFGNSKMYAA